MTQPNEIKQRVWTILKMEQVFTVQGGKCSEGFLPFFPLQHMSGEHNHLSGSESAGILTLYQV